MTWLVGRLFPLGEFVIYRSPIAAGTVGLLFLTGAGVIAYRNSGYLIALLVLLIVLLSLFTSGGVAVYPEYGLIDRLRMVIMFAVVIAVPLSAVGFIIGAVLRRSRKRVLNA